MDYNIHLPNGIEPYNIWRPGNSDDDSGVFEALFPVQLTVATTGSGNLAGFNVYDWTEQYWDITTSAFMPAEFPRTGTYSVDGTNPAVEVNNNGTPIGTYVWLRYRGVADAVQGLYDFQFGNPMAQVQLLYPYAKYLFEIDTATPGNTLQIEALQDVVNIASYTIQPGDTTTTAATNLCAAMNTLLTAGNGAIDMYQATWASYGNVIIATLLTPNQVPDGMFFWGYQFAQTGVMVSSYMIYDQGAFYGPCWDGVVVYPINQGPAAPGYIDYPSQMNFPKWYTWVTSAVSPGVQTVTPVSMTNIQVGSWLAINWQPDNNITVTGEVVYVTAVTSTTFTATFVNSYPSGISFIVPTCWLFETMGNSPVFSGIIGGIGYIGFGYSCYVTALPIGNAGGRPMLVDNAPALPINNYTNVPNPALLNANFTEGWSGAGIAVTGSYAMITAGGSPPTESAIVAILSPGIYRIWAKCSAGFLGSTTGEIVAELKAGSTDIADDTVVQSYGTQYAYGTLNMITDWQAHNNGSPDLHWAVTYSNAAITAGSATVTPTWMPSTIATNTYLLIDTGVYQEIVQVSGKTSTTFTATFGNNHNTNCRIQLIKAVSLWVKYTGGGTITYASLIGQYGIWVQRMGLNKEVVYDGESTFAYGHGNAGYIA